MVFAKIVVFKDIRRYFVTQQRKIIIRVKKEKFKEKPENISCNMTGHLATSPQKLMIKKLLKSQKVRTLSLKIKWSGSTFWIW
jgi:hypothetical protein